MELHCAKYNETMRQETAACRHPGDYCKHRQACLIHFLGKERGADRSGPAAGEGGAAAKQEGSGDATS